MREILEKLEQTVDQLTEQGLAGADTAIVLGTGLGTLLQHVNVKKTISFQGIENFPVSTVEFHKGNLILAEVAGKKLLIMQGRFHYYEGYDMQEITFPIRVLKALGVRRLLLTNAAGGMNPAYKKGDLVLIDDHINQLPDNPLRGLNAPEFGNRFVDMCTPYDARINQVLTDGAQELGIDLKKGIYISVMGPNLETRAEYRYLRRIGADMVGMSTVPEVIVANHIGLPCAAISIITDECDPDNLQPVDIKSIIEVAKKADEKLSRIFLHAIARL